MFSLPLFHSAWDQISKKYSKDDIEKKLIAIFDKKETYAQLIKSVYPKEIAAQKEEPYLGPKPVEHDLKAFKENLAVVVDGDTLINYYFCHECKPKPGDKIVAKTGRDGIRIHAVNCRGMKTISFDKLLEAHWAWEDDTIYKIWIELKISNRQWNIIGMMKIFNDLNIPVLNVTMKNMQENMSLFAFETEFANPGKIAFLLNSLKKHDDSLKVMKKKIS